MRRMTQRAGDNTSEQGRDDAASIHHLEEQRRANRDEIAALGFNPYGRRTDGLLPLAEARNRYDAAADEQHKARDKADERPDPRPLVKLAGRVMLHRDNGKLVWMQLRDFTHEPEKEGKGDLQIAVSKRDCDEAGFNLAKVTDLGDIVVAEGPLTKTKTGEVTVWASRLEAGAKSLAPPPEKWAGLQDPETRYRKRYVDLYANPEAMRVATLRAQLLARTRRFLDERDFIEVETPMVQPLAGGAAARPFQSHLNALDMTVFFRIAPELYLKRLLVAGLPRVYELNRSFRNEGVDRQHNPEFTMLEVYQAFGDYMTMLELTESLLRTLAHFVAVERTPADTPTEFSDPSEVALPFGDLMIDWGSPFERIAYADLFQKALGFPMTDAQRVKEELTKRNLAERIKGVTIHDPSALDSVDPVFLVNTLFEEVAEHALDPARPTFVLDYPAAISPLTRSRKDDPSLAERWDLFIGGMEIAPAYTELNDPDVQAEKFRQQLAGADEEEQAFRTFDADFIEALKVGMPPAGGLGIGMDRVTMLLANQRTIRDVILFPFMRPAANGGTP